MPDGMGFRRGARRSLRLVLAIAALVSGCGGNTIVASLGDELQAGDSIAKLGCRCPGYGV